MDLARLRAWIVIVVTCFAVLSPLVPEWRGRKNDSFPLSWYPMFAKRRPDVERPTYVFGRAADGRREKIDVQWWTTGGFNQGRNMLTKTVRAGTEPTTELCNKLATKVAKKKSKRWKDIEEVVIATARYDRARFFGEGKREPMGEKELHVCRVSR